MRGREQVCAGNMKLSISAFKRTMSDVQTLARTLEKARQRFDEQMQRVNASHGGLAGRPNLSKMQASDSEILKAYKLLGCLGGGIVGKLFRA